jgi:hypothetical protein
VVAVGRVAVARQAVEETVGDHPAAAARAAGHIAVDLDRRRPAARGRIAADRLGVAPEQVLTVEVDPGRKREEVRLGRIAEDREALLAALVEDDPAGADHVLDPAALAVARDGRRAEVDADVGGVAPTVGGGERAGRPAAVRGGPGVVSGHELPVGGEAGADVGAGDAVAGRPYQGVAVRVDHGPRADVVAGRAAADEGEEDLAVHALGVRARGGALLRRASRLDAPRLAGRVEQERGRLGLAHPLRRPVRAHRARALHHTVDGGAPGKRRHEESGEDHRADRARTLTPPAHGPRPPTTTYSTQSGRTTLAPRATKFAIASPVS